LTTKAASQMTNNATKTGKTVRHADTFLTKGAQKGRPIGYGETLGLIFVPWFLFILVCALMGFVFHAYPKSVVAVVVAMLALSVMHSLLGISNPKHRSWIPLGGLCALAVGLGMCCGLVAFRLNLFYYWSYQNDRAYTNVLPSDDAVGYGDAGKMIFAEESRVDTTRALGYKSGYMYCVAPILDDADATKVQFWAVGQDCCGKRGGFTCDDSWDPQARAGMVVRDDGRVFGDSLRDSYMHAVKMAEASYGIITVEQPIFVRWVVNPVAVQDGYFASGLGILAIGVAVHLVLSFILACAISSSSSSGKSMGRRGGTHHHDEDFETGSAWHQ